MRSNTMVEKSAPKGQPVVSTLVAEMMKEIQQTDSRSSRKFPNRIPREDLDSCARGALPSVDVMVMEPLCSALADFDFVHLDAISERKLLPSRLITALESICLISRYLMAARAAHEVTRCPISLLLAEAHFIAGDVPLRYPSPALQNDVFNTGKAFSSIAAAFMDRASAIVTNPNFDDVLNARTFGNPDAYLEAIERCEAFDDEMAAKDRAEFIRDAGLLDLDERLGRRD